MGIKRNLFPLTNVTTSQYEFAYKTYQPNAAFGYKTGIRGQLLLVPHNMYFDIAFSYIILFPLDMHL